MIINFLLLFNLIGFLVGYHEIFPIFGYGVQLWDISAMLIILYVMKRLLWNADKILISKNYIYLSIFIFFISLIISVINPLLYGDGKMLLQVIKTTLHIVFFIVFFIAFSFLNIKSKNLKFLFKSLLILSFIINVFAIYQLFARLYDLPLKYIYFYNSANTTRGQNEENEIQQLVLQFENFTRATSFFSEPSALAQTNVIFIILYLIPYILKQKPIINSKIFNFINVFFLIAGTFMTFSLTGVIGVILVVFIALFIHKKLSIKKIIQSLLILATIVVIVDLIGSKYFDISVLELFNQRITSILPFSNNKANISGESLDRRLETLNYSYNLWKEYPIFGFGIGLSSYNKKFDAAFSDTSFTAILGEAGIIGIMGMILMFSVIFYYSYKYLKQNIDNQLQNNELLILSALPIYFFVIIFNNNFITGNQIINTGFWQIIAYMNVMIYTIDREIGNNLLEISFSSLNFNDILNKLNLDNNFNK